jgi:hypothetical protein
MVFQTQQQFEKLPQAFLNVDGLYAYGVHNTSDQQLHPCYTSISSHQFFYISQVLDPSFVYNQIPEDLIPQLT